MRNCDVIVENAVCPICSEAGSLNRRIKGVSEGNGGRGWSMFIAILVVYYLIIVPISAVLGFFL